ncbi:hypothetical protein BKA70DRAFT_1559500 [Coprinopsis sp. MPI-PUGE-AT-0042]|nr:hypothetical protein BKA70DRAFT_1559500 [Coprinopsis sp. MPI-PUGE-AT-0042]
MDPNQATPTGGENTPQPRTVDWRQVLPGGEVVRWPRQQQEAAEERTTLKPMEFLTLTLRHTAPTSSGERFPIEELAPNSSPSSSSLPQSVPRAPSVGEETSTPDQSSSDSDRPNYPRIPAYDNPLVLYVPYEDLVADASVELWPPGLDDFQFPDFDTIFKVPDIVQDFYDYLTLSGRAYGLVETSRRLRNGDFRVELSDNYVVKEGDGTPEALTFCKTTATHPFRLGLKCVEVGQLSSSHLRSRQNILRTRVNDETLLEILDGDNLFQAWAGASPFIVRALENMRHAAGGGHETRARYFIDPFVAEVGNLVGPGARRVLFFAESTLSHKKKDEQAADDIPGFSNPTGLSYEEDGFTVTGRVDYLVVATEEELTPQKRKKYLKLQGLDQTLHELGALDNPELRFLVIEAKTEETSRDLKKHVPQAVMEAYVCMKKSKRTAVPWILSNGSRWFFGVLHVEHEQGINSFGYLEVPPMDLDQSISTRHNEEAAETIYRMLIFWVFCDPERLFQVFIRKNKAGRRAERLALSRHPNGYFKMSYGTTKLRRSVVINALPATAVKAGEELEIASAQDDDIQDEDSDEETDETDSGMESVMMGNVSNAAGMHDETDGSSPGMVSDGSSEGMRGSSERMQSSSDEGMRSSSDGMHEADDEREVSE